MSINPYHPPKAPPVREWERSRPNHLQSLFGFHGRIPRRLFWTYSIGILAPLCGLMFVVDLLIFPLTHHGAAASAPTSRNPMGSLILMILGLPAIWIAIALQVKRWHDHSKSAWWLLIWLTPLGILWVPIELGLVRGSPFPNKYGPDPLRPTKSP